MSGSTAAAAIIAALTSPQDPTDTMELNLIRQRIADLKGRLDSLRGYL
jgi:hypothetical protein